MLILRFTAENHASFRDEAELSLVDRRLKTNVPSVDTWAESTRRVAALYGPNASGKSAFLDALKFFVAVISWSATEWSSRKKLPHPCFRLDEQSAERPSTYVLDFVLDEVRYEYGFASTEQAITEEWLYSYPTGRRRIYFERGVDGEGLRFGRALKGGEGLLAKLTGPRELVLSKGAASKNRQLAAIHRAITEGIEIAEFDESNRLGRLHAVTEEIAEGTFALTDLLMMLKVADVGIGDAEIAEEEIPEFVKRVLKAVAAVREETSGNVRIERAGFVEDMSQDEMNSVTDQLARNLRFSHYGVGGKLYQLRSELQSTGTLTWLSLAAPALKAIRSGTVLAVDELDSSLHPQLGQVLLQMFLDPSINRRGAQLIFTTHDTYYMSPTAEWKLSPEDVRLVEKSREGVSHIISLDDFPIRPEQNFSRRYLTGRYGAVPTVAPAFLQSICAASASDDLEPESV